MTFSWQQFLTVAESLRCHATDPLHEAKTRAAVSRAYYAAFGSARAFFESIGEYVSRRNGDDHVALANDLSGTKERRRQEIGKKLNVLREERRSADYRNPLPIRVIEFSAVSSQAKRIIDLVDEIRAASSAGSS